MYYAKGILSKSEKAHLARAVNVAKTSTENNLHGAVIVRGGRVLAVGVNSFRNDPNTVSTPKRESSIHAEIAALKAMGNTAKGATIYVARVNRQGEERMSKPCTNCMDAIVKAGIKKIIYTVESAITIEE